MGRPTATPPLTSPPPFRLSTKNSSAELCEHFQEGNKSVCLRPALPSFHLPSESGQPPGGYPATPLASLFAAHSGDYVAHVGSGSETETETETETTVNASQPPDSLAHRSNRRPALSRRGRTSACGCPLWVHQISVSENPPTEPKGAWPARTGLGLGLGLVLVLVLV